MKHLVLLCVVCAGALHLAFGEVIESKTLNGETYQPTEDTTIGILTVTDGTIGNAIAVPSGITVTAIDVRGGGALAKTGPGQLVIKDIDTRANLTVRAGKVFFARSAGVESLTAAAAMHLDASKAASVQTTVSGGRQCRRQLVRCPG